MFNFKANSYDIVDQYYITTYKNLSKSKIEEMITKEPFLIVKEYSNPRFNVMLPKDYAFNSQYYIFNGKINEYVQFNDEYFVNFKDNNWSKQKIFETLKSDKLSKYLSKNDKNRFANMPGIVASKIYYMLALAALLFILLFNWVASPWNNEFIGDDKKTTKTSEVGEFDKTRYIVKMDDMVLNEYSRKESGDWKKLQSSVDVSYLLCAVPESKISYILIENKINSKQEVNCSGEGVIEDITYPSFTTTLSDFLPDNVLLKLELDGTKTVSYEEGIKKITTDYELDEPKFVVHKNGKIVTKQAMTYRQLGLIGLSLLPILFGLYQVQKQRKFKAWINSFNSASDLTNKPSITTI
jgi:hypothetical protein